MPAKDYSQPVFMADANAANDWGSVGVGVAVDFRASAQLDRGIDLDLGLWRSPAWTPVQQVPRSEPAGTAQAQASACAQIGCH
jgi:hypothetical protein